MLERAQLASRVDVYVKFNIGMNRLGFAPGDAAQVCARLAQAPGVATLRLMMHFARADEAEGVAEPLQRFEAACRGLPYPRSLANSAGVVRYREVGGDGRPARHHAVRRDAVRRSQRKATWASRR